jgi:hypothetical protein
MILSEEEERIIELAYEFSKKYGKEILGLSEDELIKYITSKLDYESWKFFNFYGYKLFELFIKTIKEDLSKS